MTKKTAKGKSTEYAMRPVDKLVPYANNARTHSAEQVGQIAASIAEFGFTNPLLVTPEDVIIAGHGRLLAAQKIGMTEVPCIIVSGLTDAQRRALILADNRLALSAGWDEQLLAMELQSLVDDGYNLSLTGFDEDELAKFLGSDEGTEGLTDEDAVPEPPVEPVTVLGDVWLLGKHRLMCGDSTSIDAVEKLMDGKKADMVFTDPPYGIEYRSNMRTKSAKFDVLKNDDIELDIAPIIDAFSKGWVFIWTTWKVIAKWIDKTSLLGYPSNMIVWHKGGGGIGDLKGTFSTDWEVALVFNRGAQLCGKRIGSVWSIGKDAAAHYLHPTQKPVALAVEAIDKTTQAKANILDLFLGSGSTLIACEKTGRTCYGMELSPAYIQVILQRWADFTGKDPIRENDGASFKELVAS